MRQKKNEWYRATEKMLYTYPSFEIRIMSLNQQAENLRQQMEPSIIFNYELREGRSNTVNSPVEKAVINRIESEPIIKVRQKIDQLKALKEIVQTSIDLMLNPEQTQIVQMIYFKKMTWQETCCDLCIDKNTYYARKDETVKILAWCFGYLPDEEVEEVLGVLV